jgi:hypothetical protein
MARWTEERERWMGRGDPYGDDERRFRSEREEEGMRARGWRDEDRFGEWRRAERRGVFGRMGEKIKEGVRKLTGRGPKGYRRSDERILDDVAERMARSWINLEWVEVRVENGEVTLTGFVESREDKRDLEDIADDVFGVEEVRNELRVRRGEQPPIGPTPGVGTGTTGTGAAMSAQQTGARAGQQPGVTAGQKPGQPGGHH